MDDTLDPRTMVAEAVGAFTLVFIGAGSIVIAPLLAFPTLLGIALAHGLAIGVMVSALGHISGGHFNPAVTIGFWVTRRMGTAKAGTYVLSQLAGGILAALALVALYPSNLRDQVSLGTPALGPQTDFMAGVGIEAVLTFFLVLVIFGTAVDRRRIANLGGIAIGLTITMGILAGGELTGVALNPARALGPALVSGAWDEHLVYWIGPIIGGVLAALLYHYVFSDDREEVGSPP